MVADLVDDLRGMETPEQGLSVVAEDGGEVVGHVMFTPSLLDTPRRLITVQLLSPVAVLPGHQGQGLGSALVRRGLEIMSDSGVPLVFLEGDPGF
jgi:putative acetyltransferase